MFILITELRSRRTEIGYFIPNYVLHIDKFNLTGSLCIIGKNSVIVPFIILIQHARFFIENCFVQGFWAFFAETKRLGHFSKNCHFW